MVDIPISAFNDLYEAVEAYSDLTVVYRGVRSSTHQLVPKIGNDSHSIEWLKRGTRHFTVQRASIPLSDVQSWKRLGMVSHCTTSRTADTASRLTRNPLVAAYFAEHDDDADSVV